MSTQSSRQDPVLTGVAVYLAESTDDLESECESVRDFLAALGAEVLPWRYQLTTDAESFASGVRGDLERSLAFVQLLSDVPGRRISSNDRLPAFQYSLAMAAKLPVFQWRSPSTRTSIDPAHRDLLSGADVRTGPLADFRAELRTALLRLKAKKESPDATLDEEDEEQEDRPRNGRILTFYSYKGGTGRSMALANAAWILASNGMRVLAIDWDFEAPGLHRYFRPFLDDPELVNTPGLIDFFTNFVETCHIAGNQSDGTDSSTQPQFVEQAALGRYAVSVDYEFTKGGQLDLVGAGQQGGSYGLRVNSFRWDSFYEKLGGGVFLEMMKEQLRRTYDYILVDSRTGLSDTSGICTVQMPDELVVFFTLNRQSIYGAAATAASADAQRRLPTGEPALRIWPVPTRVDKSEQERLDRARVMARQQFAQFLWHVPLSHRPDYWGSIEIQYFPYYAYEETLATIADAPRNAASLLFETERLVAHFTGSKVERMEPYSPGDRERLLALYQPPKARAQPRFFLSYASADRPAEIVRQFASALDKRFGPSAAFWSERIPLGVTFSEALEDGLQQADVVVVFIGPRYGENVGSTREVSSAMSRGKRIVPVLIDGAVDMPIGLRQFQWTRLSPDSLAIDISRLVDKLAGELSQLVTTPSAPFDVDDPNKGQFGLSSERLGRRLRANVSTGDRPDWFRVELTVESTNDLPLNGDVEFYLHPTFRPPVTRVKTGGGKSATLTLSAWGAFTVGATADEGLTRLELDLAQLRGAPRVFLER